MITPTPKQPLVAPPPHPAWYLRLSLWLTRRITGKDPMPARLLTHFPRGALGAGLFELSAAGAPRDLEGRVLAAARIVASTVGGCPFCIDMNAATWKRAGLTVEELRVLLELQVERFDELGARVATAARYARALSLTPITLDLELRAALGQHYSEREIVVLAATIAQVNFWTRFNQGLDVSAAGFFDESTCRLPR